MSQSRRSVLVTGGSHGLGAVLVEHLAGLGYDVAFTYRDSQDRAHDLVRKLEGSAGSAAALQADALQFARAHEVVEEVVQRFGGLDVLVNNVGGAGADEGPIWQMTEETWNSVIALNLKPCFNYTHAAAGYFMRNGRGTIVNIGSINGLRGKENQPAYTTAKGGVWAFTKTVAKELGPYGVNVNMLATGYIGTEKQLRKLSEARRDGIRQATAMKHLIEPEEVARAAAFLCSHEARHMTGSVLKLDAGEYI